VLVLSLETHAASLDSAPAGDALVVQRHRYDPSKRVRRSPECQQGKQAEGPQRVTDLASER